MASSIKMDFYSILEIKPDATKHEIKEAYRRLALRRHPDKNLGDASACAAFQKLAEAYDTLYDENRRILYDAKFKFSRPYFPRAENETPSKKDVETALRERRKREQEEREWEEREHVATENMTRLKKKIETMEADMEEHDRLERERLEKKSSGWWGVISSLGAALESTEGKTKRQREEFIRRTDQANALRVAEIELMRFDNEKKKVQKERNDARIQAERERQNREREAKARQEANETFARQQEEMRRKEATRRAAQEKERKAQEARQEEEAVRRKAEEIRERDQRELLRRRLDKERKAQEARQEEEAVRRKAEEIRERNLRETLHRKLDAKAARTTATETEAEKKNAQAETNRVKAEAAQASSQSPKPNLRSRPLDGAWRSPLPTNSHPAPQPSQPAHARPRDPAKHRRNQAKQKPQTSCAHRHQWPKVVGSHRCSVCLHMMPSYIFQCDGCGQQACNDCRRILRG